jgi:hypothetical protein
MTRRERLMAIIRGGVPDRSAVKLWGAWEERSPLPPAYGPVRRAALERTDLFVRTASLFDLYWGVHRGDIAREEERPTASADWVDRVTTVMASGCRLQSVYRASTRGHPGRRIEHLLKEPAEIHRVLSIPYEPFPFNAEPFLARQREIGDSGVVSYSLDHPMYGLQRLVGSTNFAFWSVDFDEIVLEAISEFSRRITEEVKRVLAFGLKPVFSWTGPELCIPPLMPPAAFERYVAAFDAPLIDLIHDGGGFVWVHCHGKMRPVIRRFVEMGVDVLNPIEPPPMGDLTLGEAFALAGDDMALEGNIETHDLMTAPPELLRAKIHDALDSGRGRRHILCPSSGYAENPEPTERFIGNLLLYIDEGIRYAGLR